ncbi:MAG: glycoside hydrolase family 3 C-terminal domain-containing protein, partial [Lachnospiraceae bacterium]|nr:glycoside hydrolase family 3 C-terminal domain-containing protein [Lachnospiraceae bacterium]
MNNLNITKRAEELVSQMTLEEKASMCSGRDSWNLKSIDRLGISSIMVADGPNGLRRQESAVDHLGKNVSIPATCFPTSATTGCSFERSLLKEIGVAIGEECRQEKVSVILGPGINIKRSPLGGRNFEYISEDPFVSSELACAFVEGVQSQGVGVSLKHFAFNNQETARLVSESVVDERAAREIYLTAFEHVVKKAKPWTIMCSYNKVWNEYASENKKLLKKILREEWGYKGVIISDWGAVNDRIKGIQAGMDVEMPGTGSENDMTIVQGVKDGVLELKEVDACVVRIVELILKNQIRTEMIYDKEKHHELAKRAELSSAVLLKNEGQILPGKTTDKVAVIGAFAKTPRYQGAGSSKIVPMQLDCAYQVFQSFGMEMTYALGYNPDMDEASEELIQEACKIAVDKDVVYIFAGLPDRFESEGFDRTSLALPKGQIELIERIAKINENIVVILSGGSVIDLEWECSAKAILMGYLGGEAGAGALVELLLGKTNPSGKLAESWPLKLEDNPSYDYFPGYPRSVEYRESIFVGYRYYDTAKKSVRYPFGYGLSYTTFAYSEFTISERTLTDRSTPMVSCKITNIGNVKGAEVVQLYISHSNSMIFRAAQELKGFEKIYLEPGESKRVEFQLQSRDFAYYNVKINNWSVESGIYEIRIGSSSRDIRHYNTVAMNAFDYVQLPQYRSEAPGYYNLTEGINVTKEEFKALYGMQLPEHRFIPGATFSLNSTIEEIQTKFIGRIIVNQIRKQAQRELQDDKDGKLVMEKSLHDFPLRFISTMGGESFPKYKAEGLVKILNGQLIQGIKQFVGR